MLWFGETEYTSSQVIWTRTCHLDLGIFCKLYKVSQSPWSYHNSWVQSENHVAYQGIIYLFLSEDGPWRLGYPFTQEKPRNVTEQLTLQRQRVHRILSPNVPLVEFYPPSLQQIFQFQRKYHVNLHYVPNRKPGHAINCIAAWKGPWCKTMQFIEGQTCICWELP